MSTGDDENEIPAVEKLYCCGNSSQKESLYISRLDLGVSIFSLLTLLTVATIVAGEPSLFQSIENRGQLTDIHDFLQLEPYLQWTLLIGFNILAICNICTAILLSYAAQQRSCRCLRIWLALITLDTLYSISYHVYLVTVSSSKVIHIVWSVVIFLYRWYCFWIIWTLIRRTRAIENGYENPSDDEYQDVPLDHHQLQQEDKL